MGSYRAEEAAAAGWKLVEQPRRGVQVAQGPRAAQEGGRGGVELDAVEVDRLVSRACVCVVQECVRILVINCFLECHEDRCI